MQVLFDTMESMSVNTVPDFYGRALNIFQHFIAAAKQKFMIECVALYFSKWKPIKLKETLVFGHFQECFCDRGWSY